MVEERVQRRLAAILAADVVGYSRLMGEDEEGTLANLKVCREAIDGLISVHNGRVFGSAGDSVIAEFASPVEAVRCATEIQLEIDKRNADLPEPRRMRFRIGVNLGDVMVEGDNLFGDGVNVAARLESLARPGGVCISNAVLEQVRDRLGLEFEDLGHHEVKNIAHPVRVYRVPLVTEFRETSPFRGLDVFEYEHADIFHGRAKAIARIKERLAQQAASGTAFLLIYGMSGSGKSSLVRAGLLPAITRPSAVDGAGLWHYCVMRPSEGSDPGTALAQALVDEHALPELASLSGWAGNVGMLFRDHPGNAVATINAALKRAARSPTEMPRLAVVVDQLEELFTTQHIDTAERAAFIALLGRLARSGGVWVVATIRTDFLHRCADIPELSELKDGLGSYELLPPTAPEIAQVIRNPARTAGLRFEENPEEGRLEDVLQQAAANDPASLPLLEFVLDALYDAGKERRLLSFAAYRALGGLEGAIAQRADEVTAALPPDVQAALPAVISALTTVRQQDEAATGRPALRREIAATPAQTALVDALIDARLLVSDEGTEGAPMVRFAHEALLSQWPLAREIIAANREFLATRARVRADARRWLAEDRSPDLLLPPGKRLAEAEDLLLTRRGDVDDQIAEYAEASASAQRVRDETERRRLEREAAAARRLARRTRIAAAITLILAIAAATGAVIGFNGQREASRQATVAEQQAEIAEANEEQARLAEERAVAVRNEALRTQSLFLADLSGKRTEEGDATRGILLALEALPRTMADPDRPYVPEAQAALYAAALAQRELAVLRGHEAAITDVVFSADGSRILTASFDGTARLWDATAGTVIAVLGGHKQRLVRALFSKNGSHIITMSLDVAKTWDASSGEEIAAIQKPTGFSRDGRFVLTPGTNEFKVWDAVQGQELVTLTDVTGFNTSPFISDFHPDGSHLVSVRTSTIGLVWDVGTGQRIGELKGHASRIVHVEYSPDGRTILTASRDRTARLWDTQTLTQAAVLEGHERDLIHAAFSRDGTRVVTASRDRTARIWNALTGELVTVLRGHEDQVNQAAFSPDGAMVVTASSDGTARIWDATSGREIAVLQGHEGAVNVASFSPSGDRVVTGSRDGTARVWTVGGSSLITPLIGHDAGILRVEFSPDGQTVATASGDGSARLWRTTGEAIAVLEHGDYVLQASFNGLGNRLVTASLDGTARIWDVPTGRAMATLLGHSGPVFSAGFSSDGKRVVTGGWDSRAIIWDTATGEDLVHLTGHQNSVYEVKFAFGDSVVLTASGDSSGRAWDATRGEVVASFQEYDIKVSNIDPRPNGSLLLTDGHAAIPSLVAAPPASASLWDYESQSEICRLHSGPGTREALFSPDGHLVVTAADDGTVRLWNVDRCAEILVMPHEGPVHALAFSPGGKRLASGATDNAVRVWDVDTGKLIARLDIHNNNIWHIAFSPDGSQIASASADGTAKIVRVFADTQDLIDHARSTVPRELTPCERKRFFLPVEGEVGDCPN